MRQRQQKKYWFLLGGLSLLGFFLSIFFLRNRSPKEAEEDLEALLNSVKEDKVL